MILKKSEYFSVRVLICFTFSLFLTQRIWGSETTGCETTSTYRHGKSMSSRDLSSQTPKFVESIFKLKYTIL